MPIMAFFRSSFVVSQGFGNDAEEPDYGDEKDEVEEIAEASDTVVLFQK